MTYYFDTSALVKIYHREPGTERVLPIYKSTDTISISELSRIELLRRLPGNIANIRSPLRRFMPSTPNFKKIMSNDTTS